MNSRVEDEHVALLHVHQVFQVQTRSFQANINPNLGITNQIENPDLFGIRRFGLSYRPLLVELLAHHLDDDRWHGDVHHADAFANAQFNRNGDYGLAGGENLKELRLGFHRLHTEIDVRHTPPRFFEIVKNDSEQTIKQA